MSWKKIDRALTLFEDKVGPPLFLTVSCGFFFALLLFNKDPQASLHLTPRDGHFDYGVLVPVFFLAFWAFSKYIEKNTLVWKLVLPTIVFVLGLQFIY